MATSGEPRKGTITTLTPAIDLNSSAVRFWVLPTLMVPTFSVPGFSRSALRKSASEWIGDDALTANTQEK